MNTLTEIGKKYKTDKVDHGYTQFYDQLFRSRKDKICKVFEIGILQGSSIKMWQEYFSNATIYAIDLKKRSVSGDRIVTYRGNQKNTKLLDKIMTKIGNLDIILDDGSHNMDDQQISFGCLFKYVNPGGYYIIEDLHTSTDCYDQNMFHKKMDKSNTTLRMIFNYLETMKISSQYLSSEISKHIEANIDKCHIFYNGPNSITGVFVKKL